MTAPRIPLFQRKGVTPPIAPLSPKPALTIAIHAGKPGAPSPDGGADAASADDAGGDPMIVQCPQCGCQFDGTEHPADASSGPQMPGAGSTDAPPTDGEPTGG